MRKIIDASHPFAKNCIGDGEKGGRVSRYSDERYERTNLQYDYEGIVHVKDVQEAITLLNELKGNVFLTTGDEHSGSIYVRCRKWSRAPFLSVCLIMFHLWKDVQKLVI